MRLTKQQQQRRFLPLLCAKLHRVAIGAAFLLAPALAPGAAAQAVGTLESHQDIGPVLHAGQATYDASADTYTVRGSGSNLWFTSDEMQFAWKRMHGDVALTAEIGFVGDKGNNHRKAALMVRQSLDPASPYADIARHGDGLTSLQFRLAAGEVTREIEAPVSAPRWVRIEKRGDLVTAYVGNSREGLRFSGASMRLRLSDDFYVGLAVCSHDKDVSETALFRHLVIEPLHTSSQPAQLWSTLETVKVASTDRRVMYAAPGAMEAPAWSPDGSALVFKQGSTLAKLALDAAPYPSLSVEVEAQHRPEALALAVPGALLPEHGYAPDGLHLAVSAGTGDKARMFLLPADGRGSAQEVPTLVEATWHSWSPNNRTLAFTSRAENKTSVCTMPMQGGARTCLPGSGSRNEAPDFSPDGQWIYFSSDRTGSMQLWRMHPDGSAAEQLLSEAGEDLDPHPSPDGKWLVYLALPQGATAAATESAGELRLLSLADRHTLLLATLLAAAGTMPVTSWSADSARVAFVSYSHPGHQP